MQASVETRDRDPSENSEGARAADAQRRGPPKLRPFLVLAAVVLVGLAALFVHTLATADEETTEDAQVEADVVTIAPRVGGYVKRVHVDDNQFVKRGTVLLQLDDADLALRLAQTESELAVAQAQARAAEAQEEVIAAGAKGGRSSAQALVSGSQVSVRSAEAQIDVARAALERARTEERKAALDLARTKELHARGAVPSETLDADRLAHDAASAALVQAEARLEAALDERRAATSRVAQAQGTLAASEPIAAQIASAQAQTELARARVQAAQAAVDLAEIELSYATVTAPEDGIVSRLNARPGQLVSSNQPVAQLVPAPSYVLANFKETQIGRMRPGDSADIQIDAYAHRTFHGTVQSLSAGTGARFSLLPPDNASGNFVKVVQRVPVRIAWKAPPDIALRAGLSAEVTVHVHGS